MITSKLLCYSILLKCMGKVGRNGNELKVGVDSTCFNFGINLESLLIKPGGMKSIVESTLKEKSLRYLGALM